MAKAKYVSYIGSSLAVANITIPASGVFEATDEAVDDPTFKQLVENGAIAAEGSDPVNVDRRGWADPSDPTAKPAETPADRREPESDNPDDVRPENQQTGAVLQPAGADLTGRVVTDGHKAQPTDGEGKGAPPAFNIPKPKKT